MECLECPLKYLSVRGYYDSFNMDSRPLTEFLNPPEADAIVYIDCFKHPVKSKKHLCSLNNKVFPCSNFMALYFYMNALLFRRIDFRMLGKADSYTNKT